MRRICLFDNLIGGHHKMYLQQYSDIFLNRFDQVIILSDEDNFWKTNKNIQFIDFNKSTVQSKNPEINKLRTLKEIERKLKGYNPEFIFFMYLDEIIPNPNNFYKKGFFIPWFYIKYYLFTKKFQLKTPITGLLFESIQKYNLFKFEKFFGKFFYQSTLFSLYQERQTVHLKVLMLPEISDSIAANLSDSIFTDIATKYKHQYILIAGSLEKRKGLLEFLKLAENCPDLIFIVSGIIQWQTYNNEENQYIQAKLKTLSNLVNLLEYKPEDNEFNLMIKNAKFLFLGYKDFPKSSNLLHKAALLETPLIIGKTSPWILSKTEEYKLGIIMDFSVEINSADRMKLIEFDPKSCNFKSYLNDHSKQILETKLFSLSI